MKPVTPESVKGLMIIEAVVLGFLSFWMVDEYMHNVYLQEYANGAILAHLTTYTIVIGVGIGLASTLVIFTLWRNLKETRYKLEKATPPPSKLKAPVRHALAALPDMDEDLPLLPAQPIIESEREIEDLEASTPTSPLPENHPKPEPASTSALRADAVLRGDDEED